MVPASTATAISIPAPAIITMVFHGILAIASFCGASFRSSAITAKIMATRPTSTLLLTYLMAALPGIRTCNNGKIRTTTIMIIIRDRVNFWSLVKASGFLKVTPLPILRFSLNPKRKIVTKIRENTTEKIKIFISIPKVLTAAASGDASNAVSARPRKITPKLEVGKFPPASAPQLMATAPVSLSILDSSQITRVIGAKNARTVK